MERSGQGSAGVALDSDLIDIGQRPRQLNTQQQVDQV